MASQYTKAERRKYILTDRAWLERDTGSALPYADSESSILERIAEAQRSDNYYKEQEYAQ